MVEIVAEDTVEVTAGAELVGVGEGAGDRVRVAAGGADAVTVTAGGAEVTVTTGGADAVTVGAMGCSVLRVGEEESAGEREGLGTEAVGEATTDPEADAAGRLGEAWPHEDSSTQAIPSWSSLENDTNVALGRMQGPTLRRAACQEDGGNPW